MELAALKTRLMVRHPALFSLLADIREVAPGDTGEAERRLLPALCEPDRIAVDVGANYGSYSYPMLSYSAGVIAVVSAPRLMVTSSSRPTNTAASSGSLNFARARRISRRKLRRSPATT